MGNSPQRAAQLANRRAESVRAPSEKEQWQNLGDLFSRNYTDEVRNRYRELVNSGRMESTGYLGQAASFVRQQMASAPATTAPVYRGIPAHDYADYAHEYKPGETLHLNLRSFSTSRQVATNYAYTNEGGPPVQARALFEVAPGARAVDISRFSRFKSERELLASGSFRVTRVSTTASGLRIVEVTQVDPFSLPPTESDT